MFIWIASILLCSRFAEITILVGAVGPIWGTLCMTESIVIKAAMATKFKYVGGINDYFFGHFLFVANLGFATVSVFGMYHLCSLQLDIMIFSGEWIETEAVIQIFYPVFLSVIFLVTGISGTVLMCKKNVEQRKDQRILNNICVNLDRKDATIQMFNNTKFNRPILKNIETFLIGLTGIGILVVFLILDWMKSNTFIWFILAAYFVINILLPCILLLKQGHFNAFLWRTLYDMQLECHGMVRGLSRCMGKTQTIMRPSDINFVSEVNSLPMPPACPTGGQLPQEMPSLEDIDDGIPPESDVDTSVDVKGISRCPEETQTVTRSTYILVSEVNAIKISPDCPKVAQFIKEMPPIEETGDNITTEAVDDAPINTLVDVIDYQEAEGALGQVLQAMPSLEDTDDDILSEAATGILMSVKGISRHVNIRPTYINVGAEDNAVTISANDASVAKIIQGMPSLEDTDEDIQAETMVMHQQMSA